MKSSTNKTNWLTVFLSVTLTVAWALLPFAGFLSADANGKSADCPNGPLRAELSGAAVSGVTPAGTAMFREKGSNRLTVNVRSVNVAANTSLDVFIGDTKVGTIAVGRGRSGQLRVDSPTVTINENTTISIRSGSDTLMSGTFTCVAGGANASPTSSPTGSPTASPTGMPTVSPTVSPTTSPTVMPTVSPTGSPTASPTMQP